MFVPVRICVCESFGKEKLHKVTGFTAVQLFDLDEEHKVGSTLMFTRWQSGRGHSLGYECDSPSGMCTKKVCF